MKSLCKGVFLCTLLFWSAFCGACVLPFILPLLIPARGMYRACANWVCGMWLSFASLLIESPWLGNVRFVFSGTWPAEPAERALVISNHRCRIDWMFLWSLFRRLGKGPRSCVGALSTLKIVLKEPLKHLPAFGWAMQFFLFLFLHREWERDAARIHTLLRGYLRRFREPLSLLLFPEGTDLSPSNVAKSNAFAAKAGLVQYKYVLHPRTRGFVYCLEELRGADAAGAPAAIDAIYDVTLGYLDFAQGERPSEASLVKGRLPRECHVHLTRHALDSVPAESEAARRWVEQRFAEKEKRLHRFYTEGRPSFSAQQLAIGRPGLVSCTGVALFWFVLMSSIAWGVATSATARVVLGCVVAVLMLGLKLLDGFDTVELMCHAEATSLTHRRTRTH